MLTGNSIDAINVVALFNRATANGYTPKDVAGFAQLVELMFDWDVEVDTFQTALFSALVVIGVVDWAMAEEVAQLAAVELADYLAAWHAN